ncbi:MAG TPA: biotin carboxylase N-terminal domain-containing protein [Steroidobacteraceae bacterium]|nr:biotin carboxylase N-terminal domain-containing protein [Steroidobacteraceae bacterium]
MLRRLLIANRGEIVCRIARTAQRLGVTAIAVYSEADAGARHVRVADEAYYLGPAPAAESYLDIAKIIGLAQRVGADAVHPGYGFLSENAAFAQACVDAGLIFVGPPASAIRAMGSKSASKAAMAAVGVPVAPGYHGADQSPPGLMAEAQRVGFPLIIKASAGGGGKGMQVVNSAAEVAAAVESAQRLARTAFGDDRLLLERYFPRARHVEVQIFADSHGDVVSLFDRDCSVQRRHQKIIEEAPAPGLRDEVRAAMSQAAIQAARAVGYVGAGTVEFLVDEAQNFYFMEMNTRLQVEHPVTEFITGIDLVEWQLTIATGARIPKAQSDILRHGTAMEARLYAEDPEHGYLPSVGRIAHLHWPDIAPGLRLDIGVDAGDEVSTFYDPMLGKVVAWGESRGEAVDRLHKALADIEIVGVTTNRALLTSVLADEEFRRGGVTTSFLDARAAHLSFGEPKAGDVDAVLAALWCATRRTECDALWTDTRGWRLAAPPRSTWAFADRTVLIEVSAPNDYVAHVTGRGERLAGRGGRPAGRGKRSGVLDHTLHLVSRGAQSLDVDLDGQMQRLRVIEIDQTLHLFRDGRQAALHLARTEDALQVSASAEEGSLLTPLPGTLVAVHVTEGQQVARGAPLVTVEAMKMEHTLTAPYDGVVTRLAFGLTERVAAGAVLVELAPLDS